MLRLKTTLVLSFCLLSPLYAADEKTDTIIVTAALTPLAVSEVGSAITVIDREEILRREARYVSDLLRSVPGFSVSHSGGIGAQTQVRVRGAEANHLLVLIDGVEANDPAGSDEFRFELLSTANIERIEIIRGPQSALWGSEALAGVVNIITRRDVRQSQLETFVETGSNQTLNAALSGAARVDDWSFDFGISRFDTDGTNVSRSGDEDDGSDLTTITAAARFQPENSLHVDVGVRRVDGSSDFDAVDFFVTGLPVDGDRLTESERTYGHVRLMSDPGATGLNHRGGVNWMGSRNDNYEDGNSAGTTKAEKLSVDYQLGIPLGEDVLSLRLDHENTDFSQSGPVLFGDPNQQQSLSLTGFAVEFLSRRVDRLTWSLGARFENNSDFDDALSAKLSTLYAVSDSTRLKLNIGTGRKAPTFTERFGFFPGQFIGNDALKPETSTAYDLGIEQDFLNNAVTMGVTVFYQDLKDEINGFVFDPATFLFTAANEESGSRRQGAESFVQWALDNGFQVRANYTYTDATQDMAGDIRVDELRRPRHQGSLSFNYQTPADKLSLSLVADYGGEQLDQFFPPFPEPSRIVSLDSHWIAELSLGYALTERTRVFARVSNLLGEDYEQVFGYRTPGRSAYLGFRASLGAR